MPNEKTEEEDEHDDHSSSTAIERLIVKPIDDRGQCRIDPVAMRVKCKNNQRKRLKRMLDPENPKCCLLKWQIDWWLRNCTINRIRHRSTLLQFRRGAWRWVRTICLFAKPPDDRESQSGNFSEPSDFNVVMFSGRGFNIHQKELL
jgi:hypothetical protein